MGFMVAGNGITHPCEIRDGYVRYTNGIGKEFSFPCSIKENVPKQTNYLFSFEVAFYLIKDDIVYVGRYDGKISVYKWLNDGRHLFLRVETWQPRTTYLELVGYKRGHTVVYPIYMSKTDNQTLYCSYRNAEGYLKEPREGGFLISADVIQALSANIQEEFSVFTEGGERLETYDWIIQTEVWKRDCKVFL